MQILQCNRYQHFHYCILRKIFKIHYLFKRMAVPPLWKPLLSDFKRHILISQNWILFYLVFPILKNSEVKFFLFFSYGLSFYFINLLRLNKNFFYLDCCYCAALIKYEFIKTFMCFPVDFQPRMPITVADALCNKHTCSWRCKTKEKKICNER